MALPAVAKTWKITACQRSVYTSLAQVMGDMMYGVKTALISTAGGATGYTLTWSCNGTTGPSGSSDHTDRITSSSTFQTRATIAAAAQSWMMFTDASGVQILIAYQGASDDIARVSFSPGALFTLAGTKTNQPTASDEQVFLSGSSMILATASQDRLWTCWVSSDAKMFRVAIARGGNWVAVMWGVEIITSHVSGGSVSWTIPVWGFSYTPANMSATQHVGLYAAGSLGGLAYTSAAVSSQVSGGMESGAGVNNLPAAINAVSVLQGAPLIGPISCVTLSVASTGKLGNRIDWWGTSITASPSSGDTFGNLQFIQLTAGGVAAPLIWPWDGTTTPIMI